MIYKSKAIQTERLLAAAGFQMQLVNTPAQRAHLESLTQRKIVPHSRNGETYYVYADALECKCLYVGSQEAYQRYEQRVLDQKIADQQERTAAMNENAAMDWGLWGPWYSPWY